MNSCDSFKRCNTELQSEAGDLYGGKHFFNQFSPYHFLGGWVERHLATFSSTGKNRQYEVFNFTINICAVYKKMEVSQIYRKIDKNENRSELKRSRNVYAEIGMSSKEELHLRNCNWTRLHQVTFV